MSRTLQRMASLWEKEYGQREIQEKPDRMVSGMEQNIGLAKKFFWGFP